MGCRLSPSSITGILPVIDSEGGIKAIPLNPSLTKGEIGGFN
jgi:hypothetical protein